jgi:peptidoglycan/LPS O-acetylase OafA/YrhL
VHRNTRLQFLDGLRGWAAFCVFLGHLGLTQTEPMSVFYNSLARIPLRLLTHGWDAVVFFFLISGAALSYKFFMDPEIKSIVKMAQFRYIRLCVPVLCAVLFIYVFLASGLIVDPSGQTFDTSFLGLLKNFYYSTLGNGSFPLYNPNLWTIPIEMLGSFLIFSILILFGTSKLRYAVYCLSIILLAKTFYVCFIIGLFVCDIYSQVLNLSLREIQKKGFQGIIINLMLRIMSLIFACAFFWTFSPDTNTHAHISKASVFIANNICPESYKTPHFSVIFSFILVFLSPLLQYFFSNRVFLFLGRISFALYLFHWPIIWFIYSKTITITIEKIFYKLDIITIAPWFQLFLCISLCILYAYLFTIFFEEKLLKKIKNFIFYNDSGVSKIKAWIFVNILPKRSDNIKYVSHI